jgi:hypothetical protein
VEKGLLGHFRLGVALTGSASGGDFGTTLRYGSTLGAGAAFDLAFGISESAMLGLHGSLGWFGAGSECSNCSFLSPSGGAFIRYHLVHGLRLDPWISYGLGVRAFDTSGPNAAGSALAFEWMRATVGADWFASKNLAFGPFLELRLATTTSTTHGDSGQTLYEGNLGLRVALGLGSK